MKNLIDTKYWLFDLDNTLYSGQTKVFSEVDKKMSSFISKKFDVDLIKAREIQKKYFSKFFPHMRKDPQSFSHIEEKMKIHPCNTRVNFLEAECD